MLQRSPTLPLHPALLQDILRRPSLTLPLFAIHCLLLCGLSRAVWQKDTQLEGYPAYEDSALSRADAF